MADALTLQTPAVLVKTCMQGVCLCPIFDLHILCITCFSLHPRVIYFKDFAYECAAAVAFWSVLIHCNAFLRQNKDYESCS